MILFLVLFLGCIPAAYLPVEDSGDCSAACEVLAKWSCPESRPTPNGATCPTVCEANREMLRVSCVASSTTLDGLRGCNVECRQ